MFQRRRKALAVVLAVAVALPLQIALVAAPAAAAPAPLAIINAAQFAGTEYLIVTPLAYASAMQSIADWKTQKGVPALVANLEDITASYAGRDNAEKVHEFLRDVYYNGTDRGLQYVLLGGGSALVPVRYLHLNGSAMNLSYADDNVLSDVYFAGLSSTWDSNGDQVYGDLGETDWDAEVYVGRLPFNSPAEAGFARDNLLSYEKAPFVGPWMASAAAFASVMDPPNDFAVYDWWEDNAMRVVTATQPSLPATMSLDVLADYYELDPGNYSTANDRLSNASMVASINAGKSVVMSITHGWVPSGRGIPEYRGYNGIVASWGDGLTYQNASSFTNFGQLSFAYVSSCIVGDFANPALPNFGRFVLQDNHGFIAEIVPSDGTLRGEDAFFPDGISEGNWWQVQNYWHNFFNGAEPFRPGPALYQGIRDYDEHMKNGGRAPASWGGYSNQKGVYNLLGDPEVPIWTDIAQTFNGTLPLQIYTAESHFRATFRDSLGRPAAGATVALMGPGVYVVATADAQGRVDIVVSPSGTGSLRITATLHNFIPFEATVPIQTAPADLAISPSNVTLPAPTLRTGLPANVSFTVRNVGQLTAGSADARATATPPSGLPQVVAPSLSLGALSPGAQAGASFEWTPSDDGLWTLDILVDPGDAVAEFDELNNQASLPVYASSVDLAFAPGTVHLNPAGQVAPGGIITATGSLARVGLVPRSFLVGYELLRGDASVASSGNTFVSTTEADFLLEVLAPEAGTFTLRLTADSALEIVEFDESNNDLAFAVRAGAGPAIFALPSVLLDEDDPPTTVISDLSSFVADPDTPFDELVLSATASSPYLQVWVAGRELVAAPSPNWAGSGTVTLTASDGRETGAATTPFTVRAIDQPPAVQKPPPLTAAVGEPFVYQIEAMDPDGGPVTYTSSATGPASLPALPIDASGRVSFVPPADLAGSWTFQIAVKDATNHTTYVDIHLYVLAPNHPPALIDLGLFEVRRGQQATFHLAALDPEGDPVIFSSNSSRAVVLADGTLWMDELHVAALPGGESVIPVTVSDGLANATGFVRVRVLEAETAAAYGADLSVMISMLVALGAVAAGAAFTLRRRRA